MNRPKLLSKNCSRCGTYKTGTAYYPTKSPFFRDGLLTICKECLDEIIDIDDWQAADKFCQWADYPFYPSVWAKLRMDLGKKALEGYVRAYVNGESYESIDWSAVHKEWKEAVSDGSFREKVPEISERLYGELRYIWGDNYSKDDLTYMDNFYKGLCTSHNIITETQRDNARNLAKLSVRISRKISNDEEVDKDIKSYTELMKTGGFTTENIKNMSDFESVGEVMAYLEKIGWKNPYYDGVAQDVVDETITNMQSYLRRLVMGETNLKETVEQRLGAIGLSAPGKLELSDADLDRYETDGFTEMETQLDYDDESGEMVVE